MQGAGKSTSTKMTYYKENFPANYAWMLSGGTRNPEELGLPLKKATSLFSDKNRKRGYEPCSMLQ